MMITDFARFILYGSNTYQMAKKPTISSYLWGLGQNFLRRRFGLHSVSAPGVIDFLRHYGMDWLSAYLGIADNQALPAGWPVQIFKVADEVVKARGGSVTVGDGLSVPCFTLDARSATVLPAMWVAPVNFENSGCDFDKIKRAEEAIEDALARRCNKQLNIRVMTKPARIEIDNPHPPTMRLADQWPRFLDGKTYPTNAYALGLEASGDRLAYNRLDNANEFSIAYFGASGSGKTQAMLSALLTICATTSPADLAIIVIDPKALDFPVSGLPHLAHPIITDATLAKNVVLSVVEEMDRRVKIGSRSAGSKRVLLMIDELSDLLAQQKGSELEDALVRLGQKGRAWGFSMMIGSQRAVNESFPRSIHAQMPARWVGRVMNKGEAAFASGAEGCDAHKLPGKGAAMIYEPTEAGARVQSLFVADANKPDYADQVGRFVSDIQKKWPGVATHWRLGWQPDTPPQPTGGAMVGPDIAAMVEAAVRKALLDMATVTAVEDDEDTPTEDANSTMPDFSTSGFEPEFMAELWQAYRQKPDKFTVYRVKKLHESRYGSALFHDRAQRAYDAIMSIPV